MGDDTPSPLNNVITIDDDRIKSHLDRVVRGSVEETLNGLLDAEADRLCNAQRNERSEAPRDARKPVMIAVRINGLQRPLRCAMMAAISFGVGMSTPALRG